MSCIIKNCFSKAKDTTLFSIPINEDFRKKWIESIEQHQIFDYSASNPLLVCINHFQPHEIIHGTRKRISSTAVPSIFPLVQNPFEIKDESDFDSQIPLQIEQPNTMKRALSPTGPTAKIQKLGQSPQSDASSDQPANSLIGKKVRLNIGDLKNMSTFVGSTQASNTNTGTLLMRNLAPAKNPSQISTNQIRTLPTLRFVVRKTSVAPEKILVSKKTLNSFDHAYVDPLETNIKLEIPTEDEILEDESTGQRLKVIDIDKLRQQTPIASKIKKASEQSHKANRTNPLDTLKDDYNVKINEFIKVIQKLQTENRKLKEELSAKTITNESVSKSQNNPAIVVMPSTSSSVTNESIVDKTDDNQPSNQYCASKQCTLCKKWMHFELRDQHLCLNQASVACHICNMKFHTIDTFLDHIKNNHNRQTDHGYHNKIRYKCNSCSLVFPNPILLECHKISHQKEKTGLIATKHIDQATYLDNNFFQCAKCSACFAKPQDLNKHIQQVHIRWDGFVCYYCGKSFDNSSQLERHLHTVHRNMYECDICKPKLETLIEFHMVHKKQINTVQEDAAPKMSAECPDLLIFECFICKVEIESVPALRRHMEIHARDQKCKICKAHLSLDELNNHLCGNQTTISCEYCEESFTSTIKLLEHLKSPHEKKRLYRCQNCSKFFPMIALRHYHMAQHEDEVPQKKYPCNICSRMFAGQNRLNKHKKSHDEKEKNYLCDECGMGFKSERNLQSHKTSSVHSEKPTLQCPDCPRKFFNNSHLYKHSQRHQNVKYVCDICNNEFKTSNTYRKHIKIHTRTEADRRFECQICSMKFYDKKTLRKHHTVHNGSRSHQCQYCDASYKYKGDLNKHLRTHLDDGKIHQCTMCTSRFYYPEELDEHIYEHYKKDKENGVNNQSNQEAKKENDDINEEIVDDCITNNILSPSIMLKPTFVHENVQLWD